MNKLIISSISFQAVFILIWFQLQDQHMYNLKNNFLGSTQWIKLWSTGSEVCGSWHLLKEVALPRWNLCWGPIIIGELILRLLIWRFSRDDKVWLGWSRFLPPFFSLDPPSPCCILHTRCALTPLSCGPIDYFSCHPSMNKQDLG